MSTDICVKSENISKMFHVLKRRTTLLRVIKALFLRDDLRKKLWALKGVSFEIEKGDKIAVIGKNGSGKTTLLRLISGIFEKTDGELTVNSEPKVIFNLSIGLNMRLSVIDNIYLFGAVHGLSRKYLSEKQDDILGIAGLRDQAFSPLKRLSMGQQQRLALSVFFQTTGDFYIFDESTAFVDLWFEKNCEKYFQNLFSSETTVILTSHNIPLMRKYCTRAIWLDEGIIRRQGPFEEVIGEYQDFAVKDN